LRDFATYAGKRKLLGAAVLVFGALLLSWILSSSGALEPYSLKTLDLLFRIVPLPPASPDVVLITVAQPDLDFFKERGITWPWPRQIYAPILDFCRRAKARAVIMDILFTEPSSYGAEDDDRFAHAIEEAGNVVLPFFLSRNEGSPNATDPAILRKAAIPVQGKPPPGLPEYRSILMPIPPLAMASRTLGNVESRPDRDGIYRRVPLAVPYGETWLPLLSFAAFHHLESPGPYRLEEGAWVQGAHRIPLDARGHVVLRFRGPSGSHRSFSAANVIQSENLCRQGLSPIYPPEALAGKWVLVGLTAPGLLDLKASPVDAVYPGVEIHATLLDNLLQRDFLRLFPQAVVWAWTLMLACGMVTVVLYSPRLSTTLGALALLLLVHHGAVLFAFRAGQWGDPVLPGVALALSFTLAASYSYATEGRQKKSIRRAFAQYMSETVITDLLQHPEKLKLGGEKRRVTLFFSDLAGFTTFSEKLTPEELVRLLNDYLSIMTEIIMEEGGTVDKFEGDAIMAFWGAPLDQEDQAMRACRAALRQQAAMAQMNRTFRSRDLPTLKARMGIHTGDAIVGNLGSQRRFDYTVIGDTVNLASRLEGLNKFYGTSILATEITVAECGDGVEFREVDRVAVKGREAPVAVFEVAALKGEISEAKAAARDGFAQGLERYREGRFSEAAACFSAALERLPEDGPSRVFLERCRRFEAHPPEDSWDAVFRPDQK
jgi:adenylate cyclase